MKPQSQQQDNEPDIEVFDVTLAVENDERHGRLLQAYLKRRLIQRELAKTNGPAKMICIEPEPASAGLLPLDPGFSRG